MEIHNEQVKKRIMFNKDSDHYFIAYNSLLILNNLNCYEGKSNFVDFRKLIFILPFISDEYLLRIVTKSSALKEEEIRILEDIYINAKLREPILKSILFTLEKKGYVKLEKNNTRKSIDIRLVPNTIEKDFFKSELFKIESLNIAIFKSNFNKLGYITIESLLDKVFKEKGVIIWDV